MKFKKRFLALLLAVIVAGTTACGGGGGAGGAKGDQYINYYLQADPTTLDPQKGNDMYGNYIVMNVYEPLLRVREKDGKMEIENAGAESYEVSKDKKTYTFKLRENKWADGQPVKAQDYEYGIKRSADPKTGSEMAFLLAPLKNFDKVNAGKAKIDELGVKAVDDKTLKIELQNPTNYFIRLVPFRVMMPQRKDIVDKHKESFGSEGDTIMGNGPFKIDHWTHNSELKLVKSDTYWDKDKVKLGTVNYKIMTDVNTVLNALEVGEIDAAQTNLKEWTDKFDKKDNLEKKDYVLPSVNYLAINTKDPLMKNQKIRQAIQIAVDREGLNNQVYQGVTTPAYSWIPSSITLNGEDFSKKSGTPVKDLMAKNKDPKALFIEGLKELKMDPDPSKVKLTFMMTNTPILKSVGEYTQANLKQKLGVDVELNMMEWPVLNTNITKGNYQIGYLAWTADYDDPFAMLSLFTKAAAAVRTGWSSDAYDKLVMDASIAKDNKTAAELYKKADDMLIENSPIVPMYFSKTNKYNYKYVKNMPVSEFNSTGWKYVYTEGR